MPRHSNSTKFYQKVFSWNLEFANAFLLVEIFLRRARQDDQVQENFQPIGYPTYSEDIITAVSRGARQALKSLKKKL